jgi:fluoroquinolone transport system permease protein
MTARRVSLARTLAGVDVLQVRRDPLLRWVIVVPLFLALATRAVLPPLLARLEARVGLPLVEYYDPIMGAALLLLVPMLVGMVTGFLLLDQRDDNTISAIRVTPLPLRDYVAFRLAAPTALSCVITLVALPLAGGGAPGPLPLLLASLAAAPAAPLYALVLAAFAANKVQGFALIKVVGAITTLPVFSLFMEGPAKLLPGVVPTWWPTRLYWALSGADAGPAWLFAAGSAVYAAVLLLALWRRFMRRLLQA